jgi:hypothetical protein
MCLRIALAKTRRGEWRMSFPAIAESLGAIRANYQFAKKPAPWWFNRLVQRLVYLGKN